MLWFIIVAVALVAVLVAVEVRSWKKPSRLSPFFQAGYIRPSSPPTGKYLEQGPSRKRKP